ncbi:unnamed protein product [Urochloa humidicola]
MSSYPSAAAKKKPQSPKVEKEEVAARSYSVIEVDPALEDPMLLEIIREKNKDVLTCVLDPSRGNSKTSKSNTAETVWYMTSGSHHVTGNLDLLTDLSLVTNRWIRWMVGSPSQVLARGSVNNNGIILHDVWFVPDCKVNLVSCYQLGLIWYLDSGVCSLIRPHDKAVVGKAHTGAVGLLELDFVNSSSDTPWYIASSVSQHMTGDLHLLTDFVTIRPSHIVQTHTGARLQVCGKGSVKTGQFNIPNVSYVPGLSENIISVSQLTDTGFTVMFGADGFTVKKSGNETKVGSGSYGGNQLFHLDSLMIPVRK